MGMPTGTSMGPIFSPLTIMDKGCFSIVMTLRPFECCRPSRANHKYDAQWHGRWHYQLLLSQATLPLPPYPWAVRFLSEAVKTLRFVPRQPHRSSVARYSG